MGFISSHAMSDEQPRFGKSFTFLPQMKIPKLEHDKLIAMVGILANFKCRNLPRISILLDIIMATIN